MKIKDRPSLLEATEVSCHHLNCGISLIVFQVNAMTNWGNTRIRLKMSCEGMTYTQNGSDPDQQLSGVER